MKISNKLGTIIAIPTFLLNGFFFYQIMMVQISPANAIQVSQMTALYLSYASLGTSIALSVHYLLTAIMERKNIEIIDDEEEKKQEEEVVQEESESI